MNKPKRKTIVLDRKDFDLAIAEIGAELKAAEESKEAIQKIRERYREALGLIYVREYTVQAYVRPWQPRKKKPKHKQPQRRLRLVP